MKKLGGAYTTPLTFFSDSYSNGNFHDISFWEKERASWGEIAHRFPHKSTSEVTIDGNKRTITSESEVQITTDGLIVSQIPSWARNNEQALIGLNCHLSSFLALLNMGGVFFSPLSEKQLANVSLKGNALTQDSGGGDEYSQVTLDRTLHRYRIPLRAESQIIDFGWAGLRILSGKEMEESHELGRRITDRLDIQSNQLTLSLEAYENYTLHKWNNTLLLGWAFLEILINKLWGNEFLADVKAEEEGRKGRIQDARTYTASVRTEVLYAVKTIDMDLYNKLNNFRRLRNDLIHDGRSSQENEVSSFFDLTVALIRKLTKIEPRFRDPGWSRPAWPGLG